MKLDDKAASRIRDRMLDAVDLAATFVLATECALTAVRADFDLFGILVLSFVGSAGGAVIRDRLLGEHPPAPFRDWRYAALALAATSAVILASFLLGRIANFTPPLLVDIFEGGGLALAAVAGARKCLDYGLNSASVVIIATVNGCGGGMLRDVLIARVPRVLHEDFYATAAIAGATLLVLLVRRCGVRPDLAGAIGGLAIFALRTAALLGAWRLPHLR